MNNIRELIVDKYQELTSRQRKAAKFIMDKPDLIGLYPAKKIGELSETSETTVIRLCYALGYTGYSELQNEVRQQLVQNRKKSDPWQDFKGELSSEKDPVAHVLQEDINYIRDIIHNFDEERLNRAVKLICEAEEIIVCGLRTSHSVAHWLAYTLNVLKGNAILYRGEIDDGNYLVTRLNKTSLVITISFPRYAQETTSFAQAAKAKKAKILSITDDELSPTGRISDLVIKATTPKPTTIKGMAVVFSILNVLITGVTVQQRKQIEDRINVYNLSSEQYDSFFHEDKTGR